MDKFWLKSYPCGIPNNIDPNDYPNLYSILDHSINNHPDNIAFSCFGKGITYKELDLLSSKLANYFKNVLHLRKGSRVAIMLPNILQFPVVMFACLRLGLVVVNVNPLYTVPELVHQMNDSGAKTIVVMDRFANVVQKAIPKTPLKNILVTGFGDMYGLKGRLINFILRTIKKQVPKWKIKSSLSFRQAIKSSPLKKDALPVGDDLAFLQYTGGTTGVAKGAMLTHKNIVANVLQLKAWIDPFMGEDKDVVIEPLPLYHIYSLTVNLTFMQLGAENVLITNPRDRKAFVQTLKKIRFTFFVGINTLFNSLLHDDVFNKLDFSALRYTIAGGMAMQESVAQQWHKLTGTAIVQAYGLTETSPAVCANPLNVKEFNGSVGLALPSTHVAIFDADHNPQSIGEVGEICVKGPQVMRGYWRRDKETRATIVNGWLHTGDMARMDKDGYIYIVDRKKDMIIVSGFNVYPNEVEDVIASHPDVKEVAVVGVQSDKTGEAVKAFVVRENSNLTDTQVIQHCREHLTSYKVPKLIKFEERLPKSNIGKILRRELRDKC